MTTSTPTPAPSPRSTVRRLPERGRYDRDTIDAILDEAFLCHVGLVHDGAPVVIPTLHARLGDHIVLHGSPASRLLRTGRAQEICVTVTLVDGFVLARSTFHHSMNYRSVVVFGRPEIVPDHEKAAVLDAMVEKLAPGRVAHVRPSHDKEIRGTLVLRLPLTEASAKVRTGGPSDDAEDYDLPVWAGVVPVHTTFGTPVVDPDATVEVPVPDHVARFRPEVNPGPASGTPRPGA
ncbi:MAG: pyridoxamine 5'-phosphate oxidase family protein [Acidimicrobiales bacterium]